MMAKNLLHAKGIKYTYVDVMKDLDAAKAVTDAGVNALPAMEKDGEIKPFDINEVIG